MSILTDDEWFLISDIMFDLYNSNASNYRISFFEQIKKIIPFDVGTFFLGNNIGNQKLLTDPIAYNHPCDKVKDSDELFKIYEKLNNSDYGLWLHYQQESIVVRDTDILSDSIREESEIYKKIFVPVGMHYCCSMYIIYNGILLGTVNLFRKKENQDFTEKDIFILNYIKRHLTHRMYQIHPQGKNQENIKNIMIKDFNLTEREYQIVIDICKGFTNREIGDELFVSENTIKKHTLHIFEKTGINNRAMLIKMFYERYYGKVFL
ncbi:MAG: LuxR C-terminal-related transcriptional regulator [Sedimentibacter sp.]|uniref:response regulator transcription factor n=1 Tax=Sedimentibacter sp. TaxID=1960295 RepID=UPI00315979C3